MSHVLAADCSCLLTRVAACFRSPGQQHMIRPSSRSPDTQSCCLASSSLAAWPRRCTCVWGSLPVPCGRHGGGKQGGVRGSQAEGSCSCQGTDTWGPAGATCGVRGRCCWGCGCGYLLCTRRAFSSAVTTGSQATGPGIWCGGLWSCGVKGWRIHSMGSSRSKLQLGLVVCIGTCAGWCGSSGHMAMAHASGLSIPCRRPCVTRVCKGTMDHGLNAQG